ncbi:MAG: class I SAM-dependent methyltransferase [Sphingomicrobium sp.]
MLPEEGRVHASHVNCSTMRGSALFSYIHAAQGETPYGRVLDAGTGTRSMRWLMTLDTDSITAVTVAPALAAQVQRLVGERQRPQDRLLVGNWTDPALLAGEQFDTVLADYLLGSIEGFAPFFQAALIGRLRALTARRLYITGMEPYVIERPGDEAGALIWEIGRYHDACLLLSGEQPYREYPLDWVVAELRRSGFQPLAAGKFPKGYKAEFVNSHIDKCRPHLERLADQALGQSLIAHGEALRSRGLAFIDSHGSLSHGFAYVVAAEPV